MAKRRVAKARSQLRYLIWVIVLALAGYLGYSVWYTKQVEPEKGLVVCVSPGRQKTFTYSTEEGKKVTETVSGGNDACFWSAHIHAIMDLTYCDAHKDLPKDKGSLRGPHTHKEPNKMHSPHSPQPVDPTTQAFIDPTPLTVKGFLDAMEIDLKTPCPGKKESSVSVTVNGKAQSLDYVWRDEDKIQIKYE